MKKYPLYVAFLWHMHQPYYKDPLKGTFRLPWVRLHGTKDYLDMVSLLDNYPSIKQNFNLVPSLLEQLVDYTDNNARDDFLLLSMKDPSELTESEKIFILDNFFLANWHTMIRPFQRYNELLRKRGHTVNKEILLRVQRHFSDQEIRDLQTLFNLVWIDPSFREKDSGLKELILKGRDFTEGDKRYVLSKQFEILKDIIPKYKEVTQRGQIELSIGPFYHPLLPLLYDTDIAKSSTIRLPRFRFQAPEDGRGQLRRAFEYFEGLFGFRPQGLWPPEGAISEEVLRELSLFNIKWCASDEDLLGQSIGISFRDSGGNIQAPGLLYRPHFFEDIALFFRDHRLSDLIGFVYSGWRPSDGADDFIRRLKDLHRRLNDRPYIVSIIMDGENAWEYYENDGRDFLNALLERLSSDEDLRTITFSEYLEEYGNLWRGDRLKRVHPGSWIYASYSVWIGHEEDNLAWDYLKLTRDELVRFEKEHPEVDSSPAWKLLYIAEGSDWYWWYGDEHVSETQEEFDELFRNNLIAIYRFMGKEPPSYLFVPILRKDRAVEPSVAIRGFITPKLDGLVSSYFEWLQAAQLDVSRSAGSMHKAETLFEKIYYGFDRDNLYIRLDGKRALYEILSEGELVIKFLEPHDFKIIIKAEEAQLLIRRNEEWQYIQTLPCAVKEILEVSVPFNALSLNEGDETGFLLLFQKGDEIIERLPFRGHIRLTVPGPHFEALMWQ